jgi:two-component system CheB/CheR fusion protein
MHDIRERKRAEQRDPLLNRELAHRVKNSLAVVQSLANQTLRSSGSLSDFSSTFQGRLQALAAANDLLTQSNWAGSDFKTFVERQLSVLIADRDRRLKASGPAVIIPTSLTVPLGLALHELGTNAIKYGALATDDGTIKVSWTVKQEQGGERLQVEWREVNGARRPQQQQQRPAGVKPPSSGFGTILIDRGIPGAKVKREMNPEGFVCTLDIPLVEDPTSPS